MPIAGEPRSASTKFADRPPLPALTGVRFIAAIGVVFYHFAEPIAAAHQPFANLISYGYSAVDLFFLLSGFVLCYSYLSDEGSMRGSTRSFYAARFARIYPAYLLGFLLAAPTNILWSLRVNHLGTALVKLGVSAAAVLTMQQAWTPWTAWSWNFPAWSVSVETFFYVVFPFVAPRLARLKAVQCLAACTGFWLLGLAAPLALYLAKGITGPPQLHDNLQMAIEFTPLLRLPEFLAGVLLGRAYVQGAFNAIHGSVVALLSSLAIVGLLAATPSIPHPLVANGLLMPLFAMLIVSLARGQGIVAALLSRPFMVLLGEASYGVYILQIPVAYVLRLPPPIHSLAALCVYLVALVTASLLSWHFVETPARKFLRGRLSAHPRRSPG